MIFDSLNNSFLYRGLNGTIDRAFTFLCENDLALREPGTYELNGSALYFTSSNYTTRPLDQGKWEAHRRYIDLQYLIEGTEKIGLAPLATLTSGTYDSARDFLPCTGSGTFLTLRPGDFMLLWPHDAHMPGIAVASPSPVKKVVFKIAIAD